MGGSVGSTWKKVWKYWRILMLLKLLAEYCKISREVALECHLFFLVTNNPILCHISLVLITVIERELTQIKLQMYRWSRSLWSHSGLLLGVYICKSLDIITFDFSFLMLHILKRQHRLTILLAAKSVNPWKCHNSFTTSHKTSLISLLSSFSSLHIVQ